MKTKLFRNCPNDGRKSCKGCALLSDCRRKKLKRNLRRIRWDRVAITFCLFVAIICICVNKTKETHTPNNVATKSKAINLNTVTCIKVKTAKEPRNTQNPEVLAKPKILAKPKVAKYSVSDYEKKLMERIVYAEARGEPYKGQVAVAAVIVNRYIFNGGKVSIKEIVTEKRQFAKIKGITEENLKAYPNCKRAVEDALKGKDPTRAKFKKGARYFFNPKGVKGYQKKIRQRIKYIEIGEHRFHNDFNE